jgi:hypothetical protein
MQLVKIPTNETDWQKLNLLAFRKFVNRQPNGTVIVTAGNEIGNAKEVSASDLHARFIEPGNSPHLQPRAQFFSCARRHHRVDPLQSFRRPWIPSR